MVGGTGSALDQAFPPKPTFTEADVPDLTGKVCLVTGANTGVGKELASILYSKNATVYVAARNLTKAQAAIDDIHAKHSSPSPKGLLKLLQLDLADLAATSRAADNFLATESRLDILFNNAGVMFPPHDSKTTQGYELQLGVNCLGPFLFTKKLTPILQSTAKTGPKNSVRVIWVASSSTEQNAPKGGIPFDNLDYKRDHHSIYKYGVSKAGVYYTATEYGKRYKKDGIVSVSLNPGNLRSDLARTAALPIKFLVRIATYPCINGAYTELYAAFSRDITVENTGAWVIPFGRMGPGIRKDLKEGSLDESEGGSGMAKRFWEWQEEQVKPYEKA